MDGGAGRLQAMGSLRVSGFTFTFTFHFHSSLSCTGEGNGNPLQYSCLENPRGGGAWWAAVYGVAQSRTRLIGLSSNSSIKEIKLKSRQAICQFHTNKCRSSINVHTFLVPTLFYMYWTFAVLAPTSISSCIASWFCCSNHVFQLSAPVFSGEAECTCGGKSRASSGLG